jgi:hypothetical protein
MCISIQTMAATFRMNEWMRDSNLLEGQYKFTNTDTKKQVQIFIKHLSSSILTGQYDANVIIKNDNSTDLHTSDAKWLLATTRVAHHHMTEC